MAASLDGIRITGLHGTKTMEVPIIDNTLIMVGENGSGKTTLLRILYLVLSGQWPLLAKYRFRTISLSLSGKIYEMSREEIDTASNSLGRRLLGRFPAAFQAQLFDYAGSGQMSRRALVELERIAASSGVPLELLIRELDSAGGQRGQSKELQNKTDEIRKAIDAEVLYLPTYRRIEQELSNIFTGLDPAGVRRIEEAPPKQMTSASSFVELVEFGMNDVQKAINVATDKIKDSARTGLHDLTLSYLGNVVTGDYLKVNIQELSGMSPEKIQAALDKIPDNILSIPQKTTLHTAISETQKASEPDDRSKIICHYFLKILKFQESLAELEKPVLAFCELCSAYVTDKRLAYDSTKFKVAVVPNLTGRNEIELRDLSSGEKQIVSLFSHMYLSGTQRYFVLIDEPELSLSVPWQRRFLQDIRNGGFCTGLIAATHSPFIYENDLLKYTHSLGEFVSEEGTLDDNA